MPVSDALIAIRSATRSFEEDIPPEQRKRLGQFFTGLPLGVLLAQVALDDNCQTVIDPMAGTGDLLDAAAIAARARGIVLGRLDGIELDAQTAAFCNRRIAASRTERSAPKSSILPGNAFDLATIAKLGPRSYDLVITNPPYVRYQSQKGEGSGVDDVRGRLSAIVDERVSGDERTLWKTLVEGYSGLADLSVPAWFLAALLTRPGGRLALVVPATWRSRDYADVVRYLLLRFFALEFIVADTQPGWFSDALVRTHLVVARRLAWDEAAPALTNRTSWVSAHWLQIAPAAANSASLVGTAFPGPDPEAAFATWATTRPYAITGIESRPFVLQDEWQTLHQRLRRKPWFQKAEGQRDTLPIVLSKGGGTTAVIPEGLRDMLPPAAAPHGLQMLGEAGIRVSQGLRTGCNRFFYVTLTGSDEGNDVTVEASESFQRMRIHVPADVLRPVLHHQSDIQAFTCGHLPPTRVLDLSGWILPEDERVVLESHGAYRKHGVAIPQIMPEELAAFVRLAAHHAPDPKAPARLIPSLSAVCTNIRRSVNGHNIPRFWYMLPAFTARHMPAIFIPRINHGTPVVALNAQPSILIDANFSTVWSEETWWTKHALYALFRSSWCRAGMEAAGTPLGGGALKLEATHIRQLPVPLLSKSDCRRLDTLGRRLAAFAPTTQHALDIFVLTAVFPALEKAAVKMVAQCIEARLLSACTARRRSAL